MNKQLLVKDIVRICHGTLIFGNEEEVCENFSKDTRTLQKNDIYLGIQGEKINGSIFYREAFEKGAKGCILQDITVEENAINTYSNRFMIMVPDVVKALQDLAAYKRSLYDIPVIGITGSVGKTSTKDMIASVLGTKYHVLKTEGNYNNEIGLPLTILQLKNHDALVLEMGMSNFGEMRLLTKIAQPTIAVITMIGSSHIGQLGSRENILKAKLEILEGLKPDGLFILNNDNDLLNKWNQNHTDSHQHITYGIEQASTYQAKDVQLKEEKSLYHISIHHQDTTIVVPVVGQHFVYNSLAAIAVGVACNIPIEDIQKGIAEFSLTKQRMEIFKNKNEVTIINDCYNASYESVKAVLDYMHKMKANRKIAVLGDILELGSYTKQMHEKIGEEVIHSQIDILITVGEQAKIIAHTAQTDPSIKTYSFHKNEEAIQLLKTILQPQDMVLVKASHAMNFSEIVNAIQ